MANPSANRVVGFIRKRWLPLLIAGAVALAAWFFLNQAAGSQAASASGLQTALAERGSLTATIGATGSVRAQHSAVLAWGTSGQVEAVSVTVGDSVEEDQVLATLALSSLPQNIILAHIELQEAQASLDLEVPEAAKAVAEAQSAVEDAQRALYNLGNPGRAVDIDQAYANLLLAANRLDRARDAYEPYANKPESNLERANLLLLFTEAQQTYDAAVRNYNGLTGSANSTDLSIAEGQLALAQGQLAVAERNYGFALQAVDLDFTSAAEARLAAAQATVDLAVIKAPFAGVITDAFPQPGDRVMAGELAMQVDDLSRMLVDVEVSEVDINRVQEGQQAFVSFDAALGREYQGVVTAVAQSGGIQSGVVSFRVTVELENADEFVLPAMTAAVNIVVTELEDVLLVPNRAVRAVDGQRVVYVLRAEALVPVEVILGASSETVSEVIGGELQEGDTIVLNPPANVFDFSEPPNGGGFLIRGGS